MTHIPLHFRGLCVGGGSPHEIVCTGVRGPAAAESHVRTACRVSQALWREGDGGADDSDDSQSQRSEGPWPADAEAKAEAGAVAVGGGSQSHGSESQSHGGGVFRSTKHLRQLQSERRRLLPPSAPPQPALRIPVRCASRAGGAGRIGDGSSSSAAIAAGRGPESGSACTAGRRLPFAVFCAHD